MALSNEDSGGEVLLYKTPDGTVTVDVRLEGETVWLSLDQMVKLFKRDKSVISRHLRNIFVSGELDRKAVVAKNATTAADGKTYQIEYFSLDAILSVGYRVNSKRGTQFRIWATSTLREHLLRGYTLNERRLRERGVAEIEQAVALLSRTLTANELVSDEGKAALDIVHQYARAWRLLLQYDENRLAAGPRQPITPSAPFPLLEARAAVASLRKSILTRGEAGTLFGQEHGEALAGILGAIEQTFDGKPLYPSAQARAAHLLYFIIKDHPFVDGNKRIGTLIFLEYLRRNKLLRRLDGTPRLADNTMVALSLLIAGSAPTEKEMMVRLVLSLLEDE
jgi:prophage maintenance system killer protein